MNCCDLQWACASKIDCAGYPAIHCIDVLLYLVFNADPCYMRAFFTSNILSFSFTCFLVIPAKKKKYCHVSTSDV